ncbi:MAG: ferritin-like domain-containing protein [Chloroflexota bacterium]
MNSISRRSMLKGTAMVGGGAFLTFSQLFGLAPIMAQDATMAAMTDDDLQTIINVAATAELFATTHYLAAIGGAKDLMLDDVQIAYLKAAFISEQDHYELLTSLGAKPVVTEFYVPNNLFSDQATFTATTEVAEIAFVGAYLAAVRIFGQSKDTMPYAVTCAQIAAVEQTHLSLIRQIGKKLANNTSYAQYTLWNPSSAVPVLQPFLDGKADGFVGPVAAPSADAVAGIRAEASKLGYDSPGVAFAAMKDMPM